MAPSRPVRSKQRVLVVDDDPLVRSLLRAVLEDANFALDEAADGLEALRIVEERVPDVVILDVMMPGMNGYEVCRAMRDDARLRHVRIVMLTARTGAIDHQEGMDAGADAFFTKPFSPLDLIDTVTGARDVAV
jgi:CheY-like chemotaxis protein